VPIAKLEMKRPSKSGVSKSALICKGLVTKRGFFYSKQKPMQDLWNLGKKTRGKYYMSSPQCGDETLKFTPLINRSDVVSKRNNINPFSPYKPALIANDLIAAGLSFGLVLWITGLGFFEKGNLSYSVVLLAFSFVVVAFFSSYNLYNYHLIFLKKNHLTNLLKSFFWSLITFTIIAFLYTSPYLFGGIPFVTVLFYLIAVIGIMLFARFFSDYLLNLLKAIGISFLAVGTIGLIIGNEVPIALSNRFTIPLCFLLAVGAILVSRFLLVHLVFNIWMRRKFRRQLAIVGSDKEAKRIADFIIGHNAPFWVAGTVGAPDECGFEVSVPKSCLGALNELPKIVSENNINEIIVTDENLDKKSLISLLDYCTSEGINVWFPPKLMPIIDMKLYIDNFCSIPMIRLCSQRNNWLFTKAKYGFDALITLPIFILQFPIFLFICAIIKLESKGPVFYLAKSVGKNGSFFSMFKFRSMRVNNNSEIHKDYVTKLIKGEINSEDNKDQPLKITNDPRVTKMGKFLRKFSLDELPQLINVLKGDMSIVGPRPCLPYEYEIYKDWHKKRTYVRPGITGLWQVTGRSEVSFEDMILLDLYYIYNRNFVMDLSIMYETIFVVFGKRGAY
jgi:exopolysaccharide biosynthesis polyprenyl glycosylphosphotransferase